MSDRSSVMIPQKLRKSVEELIEDTGFQNVSEFTRFVLRSIVDQGEFEGAEDYTENVDKVRERLKNLGYIK